MQYDQAFRRPRLSNQRQQRSCLYARSAGLSRNLVSAAAALVVVLGSRDVEMLATHSLIILGLRASMLVNVSCRKVMCRDAFERATCIGVVSSPSTLNSLRLGAATPPLVKPTSIMATSVCSKCSTAKQSGERSCCARGGTWFKNCGDASDKNVDHTWIEGIQACARKLCTERNLRRLSSWLCAMQRSWCFYS